MNGSLAAILITDAEPNSVVPTSAFSWRETMHSFPNPTSIEAFDTWRADTSQWLPVAIDIAATIPCRVPILMGSRCGRISSSRSISGSSSKVFHRCFGISLNRNALRSRPTREKKVRSSGD
jgi:hypothetical protein